MQMEDTDDPALWYALYRFVANYWREVDRNGGEQAHEYYLPNALFAVGQNRFAGRDKIRVFYQQRRNRGFTTTRHTLANLQVLPIDAGRVRVIGVLSLYRADGRPPFHGARAPMLVADIDAECALAEDGRWAFRSHVLHPLFVGSDIPYSLAIDPDQLPNTR
ncbi:MAG: nuclear transport factor 2 family protein [Alphaproteobacteria bacterium]|nr:nuclear transport factor 2 family protein [Alphaproteobacteria bacterium]